MGMTWGVVYALAAGRTTPLPVLHACPQRIKCALSGQKTAVKNELIAALEVHYQDLPGWPSPMTTWEHAADALGTVLACLDHPAVLMGRQMTGGALNDSLGRRTCHSRRTGGKR